MLAGIEAGSSHPIAQSIIDYAKEKNVSPINFDSAEVVSGQGVTGTSQGAKYALISLKAYGQATSIEVLQGATMSVLTKDGQGIGTVSLGDELKTTSKELIEVLKDKGITPMMATGDNDAPSLALADVGVAIGAGTQVAIDSADVVLTQSEPGDIESFIELSFRTNRKMNQNLAWGAGYNFIAIPIAAGLLASWGITISPAFGAILMSLSTIIVAINAMTLKLGH